MKVRKTLKDNKKSLIIIGILWIILAIILVSPIAYSIVESTNNGIFDFSIFIEQIFSNITSFNTFGKVFGEKYIGAFFKTLAFISARDEAPSAVIARLCAENSCPNLSADGSILGSFTFTNFILPSSFSSIITQF